MDNLKGMAKGPPKIGDIGEFAFIRSIQSGCEFFSEKLVKGIGDDCAVIGPYGGTVFLITTDMLVEDVHFVLEEICPQHLGQKAAAVNLSDIAAMGGTALHLFVSLAVPRAMPVDRLHGIYHGIKDMCKHYQVNILGGDTSLSPHQLMINITAIGKAPEHEVLYRNRARPGDVIYITGTIGDSAAGLSLLKGEAFAPEHLASTLREAHNLPVPCLEAGRAIAHSRLASSMIDLSDGLCSDLQHICEASQVGALLYYEGLPLSEELQTFCEMNRLDAHEMALAGGEDYRLLVTVPPESAEPFQRMFKKGSPYNAFRVGEITKGKGILLLRPDGRQEGLEGLGFDHFKRS